MKIRKEDFERLCDICRELNEMEEMELWEELNDIISNIEE